MRNSSLQTKISINGLEVSPRFQSVLTSLAGQDFGEMYLWIALRTIKNSSHMMHVRHKSRSVPSPNFMVQGWDSFVANDRYAGGLARKGRDLRSVGRGLRVLPLFIGSEGRLLTLVVAPLRWHTPLAP